MAAVQTGCSTNRTAHLSGRSGPLTSQQHRAMRHDSSPHHVISHRPLSPVGLMTSSGADALRCPDVRRHLYQSQQPYQVHSASMAYTVPPVSTFVADNPAAYLVSMATGLRFQQVPAEQYQQLYGSADVPMTRMRPAGMRQQVLVTGPAAHGGLPAAPMRSMNSADSRLTPARTSAPDGRTSASVIQHLHTQRTPDVVSSTSAMSHQRSQQCAPVEPSTRRQFPTNFAALMKSPSPMPTALAINTPSGLTQQQQQPLTGKIKVVLRVVGVDQGSETCLAVSTDRRQVVLHDPSSFSASSTSNLYRQRSSSTVPRLFTFDSVVTPGDSLADMCYDCLDGALTSVLNGSDSCVFSFGPSRIGKTFTMIGLDDSNPKNLGVIPSAISWLFQMIAERRERTGARFSVRISAVELTGKNEKVKDLLANVSASSSAATVEINMTSPNSLPNDDAVQLNNASEIRAPTAESAAFLLDAAIATRTVPETDEDNRHSHLLFTLHVYQYTVETSRPGLNTVAGGRSRLHILDLGSCGRAKDVNTNSSALSLSALGTVISALLSGQRHLPHRDSKLTQLMREALGGSLNHACAIVHVTPAAASYSETTQVVQLASRIQRTKVRRRVKASSSSDGSSYDGSSATSSSSAPMPNWYCSQQRRRRAGVKMGISSRRSAHSDPETSSCVSGQSSCDTVVHVGRTARRVQLSDRDLTDSETGSSVVTAVSARSTPSGTSKLSSENRSQLQRIARSRRHARTSGLSIYHPATIVEHPDEEQWVDGPRSSVTPLKSEGSMRRSMSTRNRAQQKPLSNTELWVDGPAEFQPRQAPQPPVTSGAPGDETTRLLRKPRAETLDVIATSSNDVNADRSQVSTVASFSSLASSLATDRTGQAFGVSSENVDRVVVSSPRTFVTTSAQKTLSNSAMVQPRSLLPPPDGRVAAWVQSVQEAAITSGTLSKSPEAHRDSYKPDGTESSVKTVDNKLSDKDCLPLLNDDDDVEKSSSDANWSGHSIYERIVEECLETGSQAALTSSDEDTLWDTINQSPPSEHPVDPTCPVEEFFDALESNPRRSSSFDLVSDQLRHCSSPDRDVILSGSSRQKADVSPLPRRASSTPRRLTSTPKSARSKSGGVLVTGCEPTLELQQPTSSEKTFPALSKSASIRSGLVESKDRSHRKSTTSGKPPQGRTSMASPRLTSRNEERKCRQVRLQTVSSSSDSANLTSVCPGKVRLLSPYHAVTSPRRARAAASSDSSSLLSDPVTVTSSGYESMLRGDDSDDVTIDGGSSSTNRSMASEFGSETRIVAARRVEEMTSESNATSPSDGATGGYYAYLDIWTQQKRVVEEQKCKHLHIATGSKDPEKMTDRSKLLLESEAMAALERIKRVDELLERRTALNVDLKAVKELMGVQAMSLHADADDQFADRSNAEFLQDLENEISTLERQLVVHNSRLMLVTCFDSCVVA